MELFVRGECHLLSQLSYTIANLNSVNALFNSLWKIYNIDLVSAQMV